jgi:hypothetical protein
MRHDMAGAGNRPVCSELANHLRLTRVDSYLFVGFAQRSLQ